MASTSGKREPSGPEVAVRALKTLQLSIDRSGGSISRAVFVLSPDLWRDYEQWISRDGRIYVRYEHFEKRWPGHLLYAGRPVVACQSMAPGSAFALDEGGMSEWINL